MIDLITVNISDLPSTIGPPPPRAMIDSVRRYGVLIPIIITRLADVDPWQLVAGNRRVASLRAIGITDCHLPAIVVPPTLADPITLIENEMRSDNFAAQALAVTRMAASGMTKPEITSLTGMAKTTIERHLAYANVHGSLFDAFREGHIPSTVMDQIARTTPGEQDTLAAMYSGRGKITGTDVKAVQEATRATLHDDDTVLDVQVITDRPISYTELRESIHALADRAHTAGFSFDQVLKLLTDSPAYSFAEAS